MCTPRRSFIFTLAAPHLHPPPLSSVKEESKLLRSIHGSISATDHGCLKITHWFAAVAARVKNHILHGESEQLVHHELAGIAGAIAVR